MIQRISKIPDDNLPDVSHEVAMSEGGDRADEEGHKDRHDDEVEHAKVLVIQHLIDDILDDPRHDQVRARYEQHEEHGNKKQLPVGF
ncbi:Uncharacterised protein [Bacteroides xylanisolvens]|nr:Uncharacterised protein [Bacteroides xylanisolvens]